jgi:hypothetical protein
MTPDWYCFINAAGLCERGNTLNGYWAGAGTAGSIAGRGLPHYLTRDNLTSTYEIPGENTGFSEGDKPLASSAPASCFTGNPEADRIGEHTYPLSPWEGEPTYPNLARRIKNVWNGCHVTEPIYSSVGYGDVLYSDSNFGQGDSFQHTAIIVGWGPYIETWAQLTALRQTNFVPSRQRSEQNSVPYIVEHGPHAQETVGDSMFSTYAGYKPYYALQWQSVRNVVQSAVARPWGFIHLPDTVRYPISHLAGLQSQLDQAALNAGLTTPGRTVTTSQIAQTCPLP